MRAHQNTKLSAHERRVNMGDIVQSTGTPVSEPVVTPTPESKAQVGEGQLEMQERTRGQFEKLLESNQRLFQQNDLLRQEMEQRLGAIAPTQPAHPVPPVQTKLEWDVYDIDPITGDSYINREKLNKRMVEIDEKAKKAESIVNSYVQQTEDRERERQSKETFTAYPELNPDNKEKFSQDISEQVRGVLYYSMVSPGEYGGRPLTFKEAADRVIKNKQVPVVTTEPVVAPKDDGLKDAGAAYVQSQPQNATKPTSDEDLQALRMATRRGDDRALAQRLLNTEHIVAAGSAQ